MIDLASWPEELRRRSRVLVNGAPREGLVVYWMRVAVRGHENPALDAAIAAANDLGTSVLVYHAVSERYPYASDRHHTFILEGARDVARELAARGVAYALHVERPGARGPMLRRLAERAALVVTEDAPFPPLSTWTRRLAEHLDHQRVPFVALDASCVVPMPLVKQRFDRAYAFRTATRSLAARSLSHAWQELEPLHPARACELPFDPVDAQALDDRAIARLVARCEIDHAVGPVRTLRGGSAAGYARWRAFGDDGLDRYAERRNDAAIDGTSRLSPWLHYGHVSPLRIAREAAARPKSASTDKFLDELLVWREAAWHYVAHTPEIESLAALPEWARATLAAHAGDRRDALPMERLERARTGDRLWDLAQRSLVAQGELHNNVRMTWGKAIPSWTRTPEDARRALVALNHRYALDGRDPSSYGGLYWCLGLFDHPFTPAQPVLGTVRPRPTSVHAQRLDLDAYEARVSRPARSVGRVAVIGAGVTGLACARTLADHGVDVVVFDKGRVPGGRLASHRAPDLEADVGASYFTARDARFRRFVESWRDEGVVDVWQGRIGAVFGDGAAPVETPVLDRFVGTPGMSALARHLARDVDVRTSHRVDAIERREGRYVLSGTVGPAGVTLGPAGTRSGEPLEGFGAFDALLVCLPASQAHPLVRGVSPGLAEAASTATSEPCVALAFVPADDALATLPFDGLFLGRDHDEARTLAWLARESSKPGRRLANCWVLHAAPAWSAAHLRDPDDTLATDLLQALARRLGIGRIEARRSVLRRWACARVGAAGGSEPLFDDETRLGVGGDWSLGGRVEGAFLCGVALAGRVLGLPG
ncbi:MAG: FAD-dependent oxidoreductase [Deltaproteobacteria bacterium]|nr:FAD-dependent oxidoreductase [Deltaproteobacteria bacterium]